MGKHSWRWYIMKRSLGENALDHILISSVHLEEIRSCLMHHLWDCQTSHIFSHLYKSNGCSGASMVFVSWALIQIAARAKFAVMGTRWEHGTLLKSFVEWWLSQDMSRPETHGTPWTIISSYFINDSINGQSPLFSPDGLRWTQLTQLTQRGMVIPYQHLST